jgi:hypothetical protein
VIFLEVISKPILGVILYQPEELEWERITPLFSRGAGGLNKRLKIPLNPPLKKGDLKFPFPTLHRLRKTFAA